MLGTQPCQGEGFSFHLLNLGTAGVRSVHFAYYYAGLTAKVAA